MFGSNILKGKENTKKILLVVGLLLMGVTYALNGRLGGAITGSPAMAQGLRLGILIVDAIFALVAIYVLVQYKSKAKILADVLVGLGFTLFILVIMEIGFYYLNQRRQGQLQDVVFEFMTPATGQEIKFEGEHAQAFFRRDDWLGYGLVPEMQVRANRKKNEQVLYEVIYTTDARGRRLTPVEGGERSRYILFFGDSYTFGEGVNDDETLPAYTGQFASRYRPYNYGVGGYGPQQMLARLQTPAIRQEIEEAEGILVYTFISEHISRAIGSMRIHSQRGDIMPYYFINEQNELVRQGDFASGRPLLSSWYSLAGRSQTLLYFNIDLPPRVRPQDLVLTTRILEEARQLYQEKFQNDRFVVLIYPGLGVPELLPYLQAAGIDYLDYSGMSEVYEDSFWLGEGHPAAKTHKAVAERLVQDLNIGVEEQ